MKYRILQVTIRDLCDEINELGWAEASAKYARVQAYLDCSHNGSEEWKPEYLRHYIHVADIEAEGLEDVFHIGNMGPEDQITRFQPMHSLSVGDLVIDEGLNLHMVDPFGFKPVTRPAPQADWTVAAEI